MLSIHFYILFLFIFVVFLYFFIFSVPFFIFGRGEGGGGQVVLRGLACIAGTRN